jgi:bifunctional UDP-N-acetylglucosamine pyrophosphorylase / glucosamine-1-phosphate N-acetyltransferase
MGERQIVAVVLAAGKGTRMRSRKPKVLHEAGGRPLLSWVLAAARTAGASRLIVVVGHEAEAVRAAVAAPDVVFVVQEQQRGTGHALAQAAGEVPGTATLLVLSGDVPLVSADTLRRLVAAPGWGALAVADLDAPGSLGRVIARPDGLHLDRIVEAADASATELALSTVNAGMYALPAPEIFQRLAGLEPDNAKGELYLTDALGAAAASESVALIALADTVEAFGVNDRRDLVRVHRILIARKLGALAEAGVTVLDPATTVVEPEVEVGADTILHGGVRLSGRSRVGAGCVLHQGAWLRDSLVADGTVIEPYSVLDGAEVGTGCRVGPFARLRPGARLDAGAKVGNFVEMKNATLGRGAKAGHLSYLGDAEIGAGANIGAGTVTCNYDGTAKHKTRVGERAFVGSDTMLVAPVAVGDDASTAAGSVVTHDVPAGALAVGRAKQRNVEGWAARRARKPRK